MNVCETITAYGPAKASDAELLAMLLHRPDVTRAAAILHGVGSFAALESTSAKDAGLSATEHSRVQAAAEFCRRAASNVGRVRINSPRAAGAYLLPLCRGWSEERFGLLALNAKGDPLAERILSQGTCTSTAISPREFFREALKLGASSALAFHNHPSGDPTPSKEDVMFTRRLRSAGESLGVPLADHIVVGSETTHSFRAAEAWDSI